MICTIPDIFDNEDVLLLLDAPLNWLHLFWGDDLGLNAPYGVRYLVMTLYSILTASLLLFLAYYLRLVLSSSFSLGIKYVIELSVYTNKHVLNLN